MNKIYKCLKYHHLSDDDMQDIAIQIWSARDSYDEEKGTLGTWVSRIVKNYLISKKRSKKQKFIDLQVPLSNFEREDENGIISSSVDSYIVSKEQSGLNNMIYQEFEDKLLEEIKSLKEQYSEVLLTKMTGGTVCRIQYTRAKQAFYNKKFKYVLENLNTGEQFFVNSFAQAAEITEFTSARVSDCFKKKDIFGNKWKIFSKKLE